MKVLETAVAASFCPDQVLLSKNFHSRPGCRQKILTKEIWGWGWGSNFDPQVVLFDVRVAHVDMILDHAVMASSHAVQRYVPAALEFGDSDSLFEQPFEGTHLDVGLDCSSISTDCPGNRG